LNIDETSPFVSRKEPNKFVLITNHVNAKATWG